MSTNVEVKQALRSLILGRISKTYNITSLTYRKVEIALYKLSEDELDALWAMILSSTD